MVIDCSAITNGERVLTIAEAGILSPSFRDDAHAILQPALFVESAHRNSILVRLTSFCPSGSRRMSLRVASTATSIRQRRSISSVAVSPCSLVHVCSTPLKEPAAIAGPADRSVADDGMAGHNAH